MYSCIEKALRATEYYSPVSLLRALKNVKERKPYKLIQLQASDFMEFQVNAQNVNYDAAPFSKVTSLELTKTLFQIKYKTSFLQNIFTTVNLRQKMRKGATNDNIAQVKQPRYKIKLPEKKVQAIRSMFPWMPKVDLEYYKAILPKQSSSSVQTAVVNETGKKMKK
ncbi:unnamed protein product [Brassicogethes aeneus]|uniref:Uncharacterized protein n=1 Tax=Brassicogethes aeneus TaxID=1431903 RepID=A0A9P0B778_BRAAE|nr:unnamed protein product [Brassicogethes aeneus]